MSMRALIVVPTYNEIENIQALIEAALANSPASTELLVVDDGSPDGTGARVHELARSNPRIHALHRERKLGLGTAYVAGFNWGLEKGFDLLIEMDADFSHNPRVPAQDVELTRDERRGDRVALCRRRQDRELGFRAQALEPRRQYLRADDPGSSDS